MRIISSFKDYYDSGVAYGIDPKLVYVRETREQEIKDNTKVEKHLVELLEAYDNLPNFDGERGVIAFCGKLYPYYGINAQLSPDNIFSYSKIFFSFTGMAEKLNDAYHEKIMEALKPKYKKFHQNEIKNIKEFVKRTNNHIKNIQEKNYKWSKNPSPEEHDKKYIGAPISDEMFRAEKSPIILMRNAGTGVGKCTYRYFTTIIVNPKLQDYGFASVMDPVTAFQELSAFLGTNLVEQKDPNPHMSDELKGEIHGFDKWSFRKPGKKGM